MRKLFSNHLILFCSFYAFEKYRHEFISFIKCFINFFINDYGLTFIIFKLTRDSLISFNTIFIL